MSNIIVTNLIRFLDKLLDYLLEKHGEIAFDLFIASQDSATSCSKHSVLEEVMYIEI